MYEEVVDKFDEKEDNDVKETVQEIAKSPPEPSYSTLTVTIAPIQQRMHGEKSEQKGASEMLVQKTSETSRCRHHTKIMMNRNMHRHNAVRICIETEDADPMTDCRQMLPTQWRHT